MITVSITSRELMTRTERRGLWRTRLARLIRLTLIEARESRGQAAGVSARMSQGGRRMGEA